MIKRLFAITAAVFMLTGAPAALATQADWHSTVGMSGGHDSPFPEPISGPQD